MAGPKESELGDIGVTALEKCSCDNPQGIHGPDLFRQTALNVRMIISAEWRAIAGDPARKGVRAGYYEWGEGLGAWIARLSGPQLAEGLALGGPSALFQSWAQNRIRENRWKYHRIG